MAIQVSGVNVIDNQRNLNVGVLTASSLDVPPSVLTFSPADAASGVLVGSNIVLTFNVPISKGTGNILLNKGSAGGTTHETIDVTSGNVTISGSEVTINPSSDLPTGNDIYVVVPEDAFKGTALNSGNDEINTYNFSTGPILTTAFSPADAATNQLINTNIVITFSENITKQTTASTSYITLRAGSASGTVRQTIDVSTSAVSVSGNQATINPPSDLQYEEDTYIVVDANSFFNSDGDANSGNAVINTYNFTTEAELSLGDSFEGGNLVCCAGGNYWIVAPVATQVKRNFYEKDHASARAEQVSGCTGWFIPTCSQLLLLGACATYWDTGLNGMQHYYWSSSPHPANPGHFAFRSYISPPGPDAGGMGKNFCACVRAFRCVTY